MAENKKSCIIYADLIHTVRKLPEDKAGKLFMTILAYINDENPVVEDLAVDLVFEPIKQQLKRDLLKWEKTKDRLSGAGKASAEARKLKANQLSVFDTDKNSTSLNSVEHRSTESTKSTVTVNATVTDTVTVNVNEKQIAQLFESLKSFFGFNSEMKHINKWIKIRAFLNSLKGEQINHFEHQFDFYRKYKLISKEKIHSFNNFIADGWDCENWEKKFLEYKQFNKESNGKSNRPQTTPINSTNWDETKPRIPI